MYSTILSGAVYGISGYPVQVEVDLSQGLPCFAMVGSLGQEVKESGERVRIALKNIGIHLPPMHIAVNLSPQISERRAQVLICLLRWVFWFLWEKLKKKP